MVDAETAVLTGLFTGIGIVIANWIGEKYIKPQLEKTHEMVERNKEKMKRFNPFR